jgi:hypothetical protein
MRRIAPCIVLSLAVLAASCPGADPEDPATVSPPAPAPEDGAVLRVNGAPLTAEDVDRFARPIAELEPQFLRLHHRRLALTNVVLPLAALRTLDPDGHARAAADASAALEGGAAELLGRSSELAGTFRDIGLDLWCLARELPFGEWQGPLELVGRFVVVRLDAREGLEEEEVLRGRWIEFAFFEGDLRARIEEAVDRSRLEIVDPDWREEP